MMRIAFITPEVDRSAGGIQNTSYHFANEFPNHCEFSVFAGKVSENICRENLQIFSSKNGQSGALFHIENIRKVLKENRKKKFDFSFAVLHTFGIECYMLKKLAKIPYGIMVHGNELLEEQGRSGIENWIRRRIRKVVLENADVVFANSHYTEELLHKVVKCRKSTVIHPPVHFENRSMDRNIMKTGNNLLSVGRLVERKGFQDVVRAMPKIIEAFPDTVYTIAGDGPYKKDLERLIIEAGMQKHVFLLGRVDEKKKDQLYRECDYFIMPSFMIESDANVEGYGIVYIEANMYGKYVIATRSGGIPDAINEGVTGEFVEERNPDSISACVIRLYMEQKSNPKSCVEWAAQIDAKKIVSAYVECIKRIVS